MPIHSAKRASLPTPVVASAQGAPDQLPLRTYGRRLAVLLVATLLGACGGGNGDTSANSDTAVIPVLTATTASVNVLLPSGVALTPDQLTIATSIGVTTPNLSGAATIPIYADGTQLAIVSSPGGGPMMMGWIDATHTTISAATTAHVLAYFALDGAHMLNANERGELIANIPTSTGIGALEGVVQSELAANVDAFAQPDAYLTHAVATFAAPYFADAKAAAASDRKRAVGISITPEIQSGINVLQDPPFAAHITNSFRRRAYAFVDRVSYTIGGVDTVDAESITAFEVPPVIGVTGGVTGALTDIMSAYYGNQPTAYASIVAPDGGSFPVTLVGGSDKTTYQVTVVGPGVALGVAGSLTATQSTNLTEVAIRGFTKDFVVPTLANAVLGSGAIDFTAGQGTDKAKFLADVLTSFTTDFTAFVPTIDGLQTKIVAGQWYDAGVDITSTVAGSNTLRSLLVGAFQAAAANYTAAGLDPGPMSGFLSSFNTILNAAGGVLQVYDYSAYASDLIDSNQADQWTISVIAPKVALNPHTSTIGVDGTVVLTAAVLGVDDTSGYSYHWTTTAQFGDLTEVAGGGRTHQTDYCSSSNGASFIDEMDPATGITDTVTVQVYAGASCDPTKGALLGSSSATVTFQDNPWLGTWVGSTTSTCGYYSGPQNFVITLVNDTTLNFGPYEATFSGNTATVNGGEVVFTLNGNTITGVESDSCQTGTYTRQ